METLQTLLKNLYLKHTSKRWWLLDVYLCLVCSAHAQSRATGGIILLKFIGKIPFGGNSHLKKHLY